MIPNPVVSTSHRNTEYQNLSTPYCKYFTQKHEIPNTFSALSKEQGIKTQSSSIWIVLLTSVNMLMYTGRL